MAELKFFGASDDIFEAAGDEFYAPYAVRVESGGQGLIVRAFYADGDHNEGVWCIGIEPLGEDIAIPAWPTRFALSDRGYSAELTMTVPDDVKVTSADKVALRDKALAKLSADEREALGL